VVSIDGKALRGAYTRGRQATPLHMVNVWAAGTRMALAQRKAPNRNEVAGALEVLALLDLDGALVTADALHCRPDTAQAIRDRKGHYVLAIKSNRGRLFKAAKMLVDTARKPARASQRRAIAHGRVERRHAIVAPAPQLAKQYDFPAIAAVGRIDSWRANSGKTAKHTVRYFLASRLLSAKKLLEAVRAHWSIENNLHWVLDVLFDEDACRSRKDHAAENLALIRKLAINALQATPGPARISHKMLQARWNNDFLLSTLGHMR
jgi:predicted transposase YbfD/YdcC